MCYNELTLSKQLRLTLSLTLLCPTILDRFYKRLFCLRYYINISYIISFTLVIFECFCVRTSTSKVHPNKMEQTPQSNKPPGDAFRQQKLRAWQPIMTPLKVVAIFVAIGVAFIPTGVSLMNSSNAVCCEKRFFSFLPTLNVILFIINTDI